ncbi:type IV pilus modification protein PilV [Deefgea salmonis]|uniref:Type IV pilus modification protein PilV n=1 Tax=Deefgea salmonis TaxID=2875502 RepID=A0ABS8BM14_9NEIS|nr:type IV pilus modification protein PilV [Deefgea salmonis]MCB5196773.1 type IV pilus modification protein PilV [Deefgea salmonis]
MSVNPLSSPRSQAGFSLIEVLIGIVVLSVGLLGLAALQLATLKHNQSSTERNMAVIQTNSVLSAMRADRENAINGQFNLGIDSDVSAGSSFASGVLDRWRTSISNQLGEGASGAVNCNAALCTVTIRWDDSRAAQGDREQTIVTEVYL